MTSMELATKKKREHKMLLAQSTLAKIGNLVAGIAILQPRTISSGRSRYPIRMVAKTHLAGCFSTEGRLACIPKHFAHWN